MSDAKDPRRGAEIEALIAEFQRSGMRELHVRSAGFELYLSNEAGAAVIAKVAEHAPVQIPPAQTSASAPVSPAAPARATATASAVPEGATVVVAPYLGTFYRSPKPGSPAYVELGDTVTTESEVCLVEVMKLFTAMRAPVAGRIVAILATDGHMVESGQPLFAIAAD